MRRSPSFEEKRIKDLLGCKRAYERYFRSRDKDGAEMDNQAQSAYTNIIKTLFEMSRKSDGRARDPEEMRRLAEEILESEYGIEKK